MIIQFEEISSLFRVIIIYVWNEKGMRKGVSRWRLQWKRVCMKEKKNEISDECHFSS